MSRVFRLIRDLLKETRGFGNEVKILYVLSDLRLYICAYDGCTRAITPVKPALGRGRVEQIPARP